MGVRQALCQYKPPFGLGIAGRKKTCRNPGFLKIKKPPI
jgi:hypothetical protein